MISQTWNELEIIFVDDASEDDTLRIATDILSNSGRQHKIISLQNNRGVSHARNRGLETAAGDFVTFLDGDDLFDSGLVENLYLAATSGAETADLTICGYRTREAKTGEEQQKPLCIKKHAGKTAEQLANLYLLGKISPALSILYKKELLEKYNIRFSEDCCAGEDGEFIGKAMSVANRVAICEENGYIYMQHDRMGSRKKMANEKIMRYEDHTKAQEKTAEFILEYCLHASTKKIAQNILLPRVCQRELSALAMRGNKPAFYEALHTPETFAALKNATGSFKEKPEVLLRSYFVRVLPALYYEHYARKIKR